MAKNLVIVESPAKAKTIEGFLGKDFDVKSCYGHIRDLPDKSLSIDIEGGFLPIYEIPSDKKKIVQELKKSAEKAELIWLASDEDREGEAISWHLSEVLNVDPAKMKRIVFHEITENAINRAVQNPRSLDLNLVNAQQARRVIDRLVGYEVSPVLWRKVKPNLSAGRVQSVAVRLIVEREKEIRAFKPVTSYRIIGNFTNVKGQSMRAEISKRPSEKENALDVLKAVREDGFTVTRVEQKPATRSPSPPFTTSTLQQEASRKLGYSVSQTMLIAQKLYEAGKITYMRTDSVNLSELAINAAKDLIEKEYGPAYSKPRNFATKTKGAQEAHEAIRPTFMNIRNLDGDNQESRLYELIWKRTASSQMSEAKFERTTIDIKADKSDYLFQGKGEVLVFDGFLKVYIESTDQGEEPESETALLPPTATGDKVTLQDMTATQKFSSAPPRYTEASLVRKLEELGIGRPSTYAPTISTIQKRGYVVKESREGIQREIQEIELAGGKIEERVKKENHGFEKNKMFPTDIGTVVNDFLIQHFDNILNYSFTAHLEEHFDSIAEGKENWNDTVKRFYSPFHEKVESTLDQAERAKGERILGTDPKSGKVVSVRLGRFGPMVQIGTVDDEEKPKFASLLKNQSIETILLEEALELFSLPRSLGSHEGKEITASIGKFGPYVRRENTYASIPKDMEETAFSISLESALKLLEDKRKSEEERIIKTFEEKPDLQVLNGRYGPYIKYGKKNFRIPKTADPKSLSLEDCMMIVEQKK